MKYRNGPSPEPILINYTKKYTDTERREFLDAIDQQTIKLTDWEKGFLESTKRQKEFAPRQRPCIDRMIKSYGSQVNWSRKSSEK